MKKTNASKNVANLIKNVEKNELTNATGGAVIPPKPCYTCGLLLKTGI